MQASPAAQATRNGDEGELANIRRTTPIMRDCGVLFDRGCSQHTRKNLAFPQLRGCAVQRVVSQHARLH